MKNKEYLDESAKHSFEELMRIAKLLNIHGLHPIVIGGWAVHHYTNGACSVDIDMILPKQAIQIIEKYSRQHKFRRDKRAKTRVLFKKEDGAGELDLDIFALSDKNRLASDRSIEIPWRLAERNSREWKLGKNTRARVPCKEILLLYKAAALQDREYKIKTWANLSKLARDRLKAKIAKDKNDIIGLLKCELNRKKLDKLLKETKFEKHFNEIISKTQLNPPER